MNLFHEWPNIDLLEVKLANGAKHEDSGKSSAEIHARGIIIILSSVFYIPSLNVNLIICHRMHDKGITKSTAKDRCTLHDRDSINDKFKRFEKRKASGIYVAQIMISGISVAVTVATAKEVLKSYCNATSMKAWCNRVRPASFKVIVKIIGNQSRGTNYKDATESTDRQMCVQFKKSKARN